MRTERYRLTEWVYLRDEGQETQAPIWDWDQHADWGELYDLWEDPQENTNLYRREAAHHTRQSLRKILHRGWHKIRIDKI